MLLVKKIRIYALANYSLFTHPSAEAFSEGGLITFQMKSPESILSELCHFHGSEEFYSYSLPGVKRKYKLTEGVYFLCNAAECFWLVDLILSSQTALKLMYEPFQVWKLKQIPVGWDISCTDGNKLILFSEHIPFSDFPLDEITLWLVDDAAI